MSLLDSGRLAHTAAALAAAAAASAAPSATFAQLAQAAQAAPVAVSPQSVVITGSRAPLALADVAADLVVIDAARIATSTADSVAELLRREAGVQISTTGGAGSATSLFVRGASSSGTLVLVDGARVGAATLGAAEIEALSLANIERIEVLRGPASSLYGADGVGGVVQIFTRQGASRTQAAARLALANYGGREASVSTSGKEGAIDWSAGLAREQQTGVSAVVPNDQWGNHNPDADGFERTTLQARLGLQAAAGQRVTLSGLASALDAQYDATEYPPPNYAASNAADFRNRQRNNQVALGWQAQWAPEWRSEVAASTQLSNARTGGLVVDQYVTRRQELSAQATWSPAADQHLTGRIDSLKEGGQTSAYPHEARRNTGLALAWAGRSGALATQADVRHDRSGIWGGATTGRVGLAYTLAPGWRARALAGTSFRAPTFNDLYYPGYGVATIQPERGRSVEAGIEGALDGWSVGATVYRNRVSNLIGYEGDPSQCPSGFTYGCAANIGRATLQGASLNGGWQDAHWDLRAGLELLRATDEATGLRLARRAPHQATLAADWQDGAWQAGAAVLRVAARPDAGITLPAYTQLDLRAAWRLAPQWWLEAKVTNATDATITPARDYQALGRQTWLALRWTL